MGFEIGKESHALILGLIHAQIRWTGIRMVLQGLNQKTYFQLLLQILTTKSITKREQKHNFCLFSAALTRLHCRGQAALCDNSEQYHREERSKNVTYGIQTKDIQTRVPQKPNRNCFLTQTLHLSNTVQKRVHIMRNISDVFLDLLKDDL